MCTWTAAQLSLSLIFYLFLLLHAIKTDPQHIYHGLLDCKHEFVLFEPPSSLRLFFFFSWTTVLPGNNMQPR